MKKAMVDRIGELVLPNGLLPDEMWILAPCYPDELNRPDAWDVVATGQTADFLRMVTIEIAQELGAARLVSRDACELYFEVWRCQRPGCTNTAIHHVGGRNGWRCDACRAK